MSPHRYDASIIPAASEVAIEDTGNEARMGTHQARVFAQVPTARQAGAVQNDRRRVAVGILKRSDARRGVASRALERGHPTHLLALDLGRRDVADTDEIDVASVRLWLQSCYGYCSSAGRSQGGMDTLDNFLRCHFGLFAKNFDGAHGRPVSLGSMPRAICE